MTKPNLKRIEMSETKLSEKIDEMVKTAIENQGSYPLYLKQKCSWRTGLSVIVKKNCPERTAFGQTLKGL